MTKCEDIYIAKYVKAVEENIKDRKSIEVILNKIYEDGFCDGQEK